MVQDDRDHRSAAPVAPFDDVTVKAPRTRKRKGEGGDRRREIINAARELMIRQGYDGVGMRAIADRVGVSVAAIYVYFPDKEALFSHICDQAFQPLVDRTIDLISHGDHLADRFKRGMRAYVEWGLDYPDEYELVFLSRRVSIQPYDHRQPLHTVGPDGQPRINAFAILVEGIKMMQAAQILPRQDPWLLAELIWMSLHGLVSALIVRPQAPFSPRDQLINAQIEIIVHGLQGLSPSTQTSAQDKP